ncbi:DUF262 domain-containing protein [Pseudomonas sp. UBA6310]|uniref:DUF262 domain-containing protein n=1 Tax=Pseudomonas sp. UBA6310 TaxID=1947327 RepID=UPI00257CDAD7|nr:DUF262 domain-containing protein [Pseudomonas sp. UBA6310]
MNPSYQRRGRLWSDTDKAYLIDSILNGYDVPKLYMADFTWGDSPLNINRLPYAIVDGKQRLEAIFDFFDGAIVLNEDFIYLADPGLKLGGLGYKDLVDNYYEIAEIFETFPLSIVSVVANSDEPINELFVRLNRSKSLTGAEIRNAMVGKAPEAIREISKHDFFETNINFSVKRGADLNAAAKLLMFEYNEQLVETKKKTLDDFVSESSSSKGKLELALRRVLTTIDDMSQIFLPKDKLLSNAGVVPVYFWFIKNREESEYHLVREFLVKFENDRSMNRDKSSGVILDPEMVEYDNFNRSTNDLQSHTGRVGILDKRFSKWMSRNKRS